MEDIKVKNVETVLVVEHEGKKAIFNTTAFCMIGHACKSNSDEAWKMYDLFVDAIAGKKTETVAFLDTEQEG